jgi:hypothetical protein
MSMTRVVALIFMHFYILAYGSISLNPLHALTSTQVFGRCLDSQVQWAYYQDKGKGYLITIQVVFGDSIGSIIWLWVLSNG